MARKICSYCGSPQSGKRISCAKCGAPLPRSVKSKTVKATNKKEKSRTETKPVYVQEIQMRTESCTGGTSFLGGLSVFFGIIAFLDAITVGLLFAFGNDNLGVFFAVALIPLLIIAVVFDGY